MTDRFADLISTALTDLATEARPVDLTDAALRQARRRRRVAGTAGVAGVAFALVASPLAVGLVPAGSEPPGPVHGCVRPPGPGPVTLSSFPDWPSPYPSVSTGEPVPGGSVGPPSSVGSGLPSPSAPAVAPSYWHGPAVVPVPSLKPIPYSPGAPMPQPASPVPSSPCPR
jgi:hypothetical protein